VEGCFGRPNHRRNSCLQGVPDSAIEGSLMKEVQPWKDDEFLAHCQPLEVEVTVSSLVLL